MRTTVDLPDDVFRQMKAASALRGSTVKDFILIAVQKELATVRQPRRRVKLPLIRTGRPGTLSLTNAEIEDLLT